MRNLKERNFSKKFLNPFIVNVTAVIVDPTKIGKSIVIDTLKRSSNLSIFRLKLDSSSLKLIKLD